MEDLLPIADKDKFKAFTEAFWQDNKQPTSFGIGFVSTSETGEISGIRWEQINNGGSFGTAACMMHHLDVTAERQDEMIQFYAQDAEKILLNYFGPFDGEPNHANIDALKTVIDLAKSNTGFIVIIMYFEEPSEISVEEGDEVHTSYRYALKKEVGRKSPWFSTWGNISPWISMRDFLL